MLISTGQFIFRAEFCQRDTRGSRSVSSQISRRLDVAVAFTSVLNVALPTIREVAWPAMLQVACGRLERSHVDRRPVFVATASCPSTAALLWRRRAKGVQIQRLDGRLAVKGCFSLHHLCSCVLASIVCVRQRAH